MTLKTRNTKKRIKKWKKIILSLIFSDVIPWHYQQLPDKQSAVRWSVSNQFSEYISWKCISAHCSWVTYQWTIWCCWTQSKRWSHVQTVEVHCEQPFNIGYDVFCCCKTITAISCTCLNWYWVEVMDILIISGELWKKQSKQELHLLLFWW